MEGIVPLAIQMGLLMIWISRDSSTGNWLLNSLYPENGYTQVRVFCSRKAARMARRHAVLFGLLKSLQLEVPSEVEAELWADPPDFKEMPVLVKTIMDSCDLSVFTVPDGISKDPSIVGGN
jgi:hypothetical protein